MGRVLCISSQTVFGPVGNSAAVPALQELGHEALAVPTVILSNHPGHGAPAGQRIPAETLESMFAALTDIRALDKLSAVITGYFISAAQVIAVAKQIAALAKQNHDLHVLVDPVIGDHGALYVPVDVAEAIRDQLMPLATIATPNLFELGWLTGQHDIAQAVAQLRVAETLVTSVPEGDGALATQLHVSGEVFSHLMPRRNAVPHGTGDFLAGCYLARRISRSAPEAFAHAMDRLALAISQSQGRTALVVSQKPSA